MRRRRLRAPRVSILVVTRSNARGLAAALASIREHVSRTVSYEVLVVLNAATPATVAAARGEKTLVSDVSLGVPGGFNFAREHARGRDLVLIHDDVVVQPGWLEALVACADAHPSAGIVGSRVLRMAGGEVWHSGLFLTSDMWVTAADASSAPEQIASLDVRRVDFVAGSAMLVRGAVWDAIGGCDEGLFPLYFVDTDLCLSARRLGHDVVVAPRSQLRHAGNSTGASPFRAWVLARNTAKMLDKWGDELERFHEPPGRGVQEQALRAQERELLARPLPTRLPVPPGDRDARFRALGVALEQAWQAARDA